MTRCPDPFVGSIIPVSAPDLILIVTGPEMIAGNRPGPGPDMGTDELRAGARSEDRYGAQVQEFN